ncbi:MAG TPA: LysE family transporter [Thermoanaerobaculia bacterium]
MSPFLQGLLAGYGIAIPVGGIAVLIVDAALRNGFRRGFFAASGAATADLLCAVAVAAAGGVVADALAPAARSLKLASGSLLVAIGAWGLVRAVRTKRGSDAPAERPDERTDLRTYLEFVGLTLVNPFTVAYFAAFVLGGSAGELAGGRARAVFVAGFTLASLSWNTLLAAFGAATHRFLSPRAQVFVSALGNVLVIGLGARILLRSSP